MHVYMYSGIIVTIMGGWIESVSVDDDAIYMYMCGVHVVNLHISIVR